MEYQTPVEHINKVCDYLQTKGNILKRSGPYVRESDEETDEDETTYNTEFDPEKVAALKELFREQANQLCSSVRSELSLHAHTWHQHHPLHGDARSRASAGNRFAPGPKSAAEHEDLT